VPNVIWLSARLAAKGLIALGVVGEAALVVLAILGRGERLALAAAVVGLALVLAFREAFASMVAGAGTKFAAGDRVRIGDVEGEVVGAGLLRTTLRDDDGAIVSVANRVLLEVPVHAYASGGRAELRVGVPYRADWEGAERILREEAGEGADVTVALTDNWIELALRYPGPERVALSRAVLRRFDDAGIPIASRTVEVKVGDPLDAARPSNVP
jgi:small-conductance mechanosensitive channel